MLDFFKKKTVGLALGSGADRGFAHIGVIKTLRDNKIPIDFISGTSIGAVIGAAYALTLDIDLIEKIALELTPQTLISFADLDLPKISLIKAQNIRKFLEEQIYQHKTFKETKIPLRIAATALENGQTYIFKEGSIIDAVMASSAISGIFPPIVKEGLHLIDGGLTDSVPLKLLEEFKPGVSIGVDLYGYNEIYQSDFNLKEILKRTYQLYMARLSDLSQNTIKNNVFIIKPKTEETLETLLFTHAKRNIELGEEEAKKHISRIKKLIKPSFLDWG